MDKEIKPGDVFTVPYPFHFGDVHVMGDNGPEVFENWIPGTTEHIKAPDELVPAYHEIGEMILTVVSVHKPGKFPTRVFFTRKFKNPAGEIFGKNLLKIRTLSSFKKLSTRCLYFNDAIKVASPNLRMQTHGEVVG